MAAATKTLQKMRRTPAGWRIDDLQSVAAAYGLDWRTPGRGGSHVIFTAPGHREIVCVPAKRLVKPVYIRQFLALIDTVREERKH